MWKLAVGFAIFAALAIYMLMQGGDIDLGGEKHGAEAQRQERRADGRRERRETLETRHERDRAGRPQGGEEGGAERSRVQQWGGAACHRRNLTRSGPCGGRPQRVPC